MKVRVKEGQTGFIYGQLRSEGEEITLKPVKSTEKDNDTVISAEQQFSGKWMVRLEKTAEKNDDDPKEPSEMKVDELKVALADAGVEIPDGAKKPELVTLLEDYQSSD